MGSAIGLTGHARSRMRQRGISAEVLEQLLDFGTVRHLDRGIEIVFFDKRAKKQLAKADRALARQAHRLFRTYAVLSGNGAVVTVGHRYRRVRWP
ncbi:MAG: hypothetical protein ACRENK_15020 [Gemmatimonadaceae bacterium]